MEDLGERGQYLRSVSTNAFEKQAFCQCVGMRTFIKLIECVQYHSLSAYTK